MWVFNAIQDSYTRTPSSYQRQLSICGYRMVSIGMKPSFYDYSVASKKSCTYRFRGLGFSLMLM